eukprot:TRINITY_DN4963_c0_g3_i1.p1 TRINITY_DN4963_c0_g3~~TRINITY_DN4963_c0_g3_i1.p1  ORF type:complete len:729 (+),score=276.84 TRINITY_DN4963_c0_g3_i1:88-2187(+)
MGDSAAARSGSGAGPEEREGPPPDGPAPEGQLLHQLHLEQKRSDALRQQLLEAHHELRRLRAHGAPTSAAEPHTALVLEGQGKLLKDAQGVVLELREDLLQLQRENAALRGRLAAGPDGADLQRVREAAAEAGERHRRELREQRYKLLRAQQERQRLADRVAVLDPDGRADGARSSSGGGGGDAAPPSADRTRVRVLEAALAESRREAAALREQRLTALARELDGLHPRDRAAHCADPDERARKAESETRRVVQALEESEQQLGSAAAELAALRRRCDELTSRCEAQQEALKRRGEEYEALLRSRAHELGTIGVLSSSLNDARDLVEQSQAEVRRLQADCKALAEENGRLRQAERPPSRSPPRLSPLQPPAAAQWRDSPSPPDAPAEAPQRAAPPPAPPPADPADGAAASESEKLRQELAAVKRTASNAIATLSASLKKALLQAQEQGRAFEQERAAMRDRQRSAEERAAAGEREAAALRSECTALHGQLAERDGVIRAKDEESRQFRQLLRDQQERTLEAKQRLRAEILGTRNLIRTQQHEMLGCDLAALAVSPTLLPAEVSARGETGSRFLSPSPQAGSPRRDPHSAGSGPTPPGGAAPAEAALGAAGPGISPPRRRPADAEGDALGGTQRPSDRRPLRTSPPPRGRRGASPQRRPSPRRAGGPQRSASGGAAPAAAGTAQRRSQSSRAPGAAARFR